MTGDDDSDETIGPELRTIATIGVIAVVLTGLFLAILYATDSVFVYVRNPTYALAWFALAVYGAWWTVYFLWSDECDASDPADCIDSWNDDVRKNRILTVRTALEYKTIRGGFLQNPDGPGEHLVEKARVTVNTVGIIMGFSLLLFTMNTELLLNNPPHPGEIQGPIVKASLLVQMIAIILFVVSLDSLTGTLNRPIFEGAERRLVFTESFYKRGVKNYYRGLAVLQFSVLLFAIVIDPLFTVIGVVLFTVVGFEYWFKPERAMVTGPREDATPGDSEVIAEME